MSPLLPPDLTHLLKLLARGWLGMTLLALPLLAAAEVTLSTTVERISSTVPAVAEPVAGSTPDLTGTPAGGAMPAAGQPPAEVFSGDVLRYTIVFENTSSQDVAAGSVVITNPLPEETVYLDGSAMGADTLITYSVDGETFGTPAELLVGEGPAARAATAGDYRVIRWAYQPLLPAGASSEVSFELLIP